MGRKKIEIKLIENRKERAVGVDNISGDIRQTKARLAEESSGAWKALRCEGVHHVLGSFGKLPLLQQYRRDSSAASEAFA